MYACVSLCVIVYECLCGRVCEWVIVCAYIWVCVCVCVRVWVRACAWICSWICTTCDMYDERIVPRTQGYEYTPTHVLCTCVCVWVFKYVYVNRFAIVFEYVYIYILDDHTLNSNILILLVHTVYYSNN